MTINDDGEESPLRREKKKRKLLTTATLSLIILSMLWLTYSASRSTSSKVGLASIGSFPLTIPTIKYGFALDTFQVTKQLIKNNQFLADILLKHHIDYVTIDELARNTKEVFDVRGLRAGKPYTILSKDTSQAAQYFIYEPSVFSYVVYDLTNKTASKIDRLITTEVKSAAGIIESSLWNTMTDNGLSY